MIKSLWVAKTGLDAQQTNLDTIANNLANAQTTGFKRSRAVFEDLVYQNLRQAGLNEQGGNVLTSGLQIGAGSKISATQRIHSQGSLLRTENPLDLAISGQGFFSIQTPSAVAYTRVGTFMRDKDGYIVTSSGDKLLNRGGSPINIPQSATSIVVGVDGVVSYYAGSTTNPTVAGQIGVTNFANPSGLSSAGGGLYFETYGSGVPQGGLPGEQGRGIVQQYYTEQSNVNVAEELVSLISTQRAYEVAARCITASDQMLQKLGQM